MVAIASTNAVIAVVIGLTLSNVLQPGRLFSAGAVDQKAVLAYESRAKELNIGQELLGYLPTNVIRPFSDNAVVTIIILAVLAGAAFRKVKDEQKRRGDRDYLAVEGFVATCYRAVEVVLGWVILLIPIAVFAAVASAVGERGFSVFRALAAYVGVAVLGMALQVFVVYQAWIVLGARMPLRTFWAGAREAVVYALGVASSMATLPVTLRCLDRMKVSPRSARLAACVGTNLNNDGILLYRGDGPCYSSPRRRGSRCRSIASSWRPWRASSPGSGSRASPTPGSSRWRSCWRPSACRSTSCRTCSPSTGSSARCRAMTNVLSDILVAVLLDRFDPVESGPHLARNDPDGI